MKLREWLARMDRLQQGRLFKIVASIVVVALAAAGYGVYVVRVTAPQQQTIREAGDAARAELDAMRQRIDAGAASGQIPGQTTGQASPEQDAQRAQQQSALQTLEAMERIARDIAAARASPANVGLAVALGVAVALVVIWLGLGLTYLALGLTAGLVAWFLALPVIGWTGLAALILGAAGLTAAFTALMQVLRLALGGPGAVVAIARNVLAEAVRMRLSVVFIVILIFTLAGLPLLLDPTTPLRYRVQSFLQFGTGGSFWIVALLTVFFAVASVCFEQRDKQIWQTMTKPVAPWQYVLGKWLGVVSLNAVLLVVCLAGVFMFTEYLRRQPAEGEQVREVTAASAAAPITPDRMILETQILTARAAIEPDNQLAKDSEEFEAAVQRYVERVRVAEPDWQPHPAVMEDIRKDLFIQLRGALRTVEVGGNRTFTFSGLQEARRHGLPLTLRYKINAGGNRPDEAYRVTFFFQGQPLAEREVALGITERLTIPTPNLINEDGTAQIMVINGVIRQNEDGAIGVVANPESMTFAPEDGLELSFTQGTFTMNLARVGLVLWVKLAFLAMLGVFTATFLSFPVACLVAMAAFLAAEGAGFLSQSLEYYDALDPVTREIAYWKIPVRAVGLAVAWMFGTYAELAPTQKLVDGKLLGWGAVSFGTTVLLAWSAALFAGAVAIFRKRELATYSGH